jgi:hypothetical protein
MRGVGWKEALVATARVPPVSPEEGDAGVEGGGSRGLPFLLSRYGFDDRKFKLSRRITRFDSPFRSGETGSIDK